MAPGRGPTGQLRHRAAQPSAACASGPCCPARNTACHAVRSAGSVGRLLVHGACPSTYIVKLRTAAPFPWAGWLASYELRRDPCMGHHAARGAAIHPFPARPMPLSRCVMPPRTAAHTTAPLNSPTHVGPALRRLQPLRRRALSTDAATARGRVQPHSATATSVAVWCSQAGRRTLSCYGAGATPRHASICTQRGPWLTYSA